MKVEIQVPDDQWEILRQRVLELNALARIYGKEGEVSEVGLISQLIEFYLHQIGAEHESTSKVHSGH